jgi:hypothetical protein
VGASEHATRPGRSRLVQFRLKLVRNFSYRRLRTSSSASYKITHYEILAQLGSVVPLVSPLGTRVPMTGMV